MIIEESDFRLESVTEDRSAWDLYLKYTVKPRGGEPHDEFQLEGYGYALQTAIKFIAHYRVEKKHPDESISLKTFLKEYKEAILEIKKLCDM